MSEPDLEKRVARLERLVWGTGNYIRLSRDSEAREHWYWCALCGERTERFSDDAFLTLPDSIRHADCCPLEDDRR